MFRQMRRFKQQLANDETLALLDSATSGVLSLIGDDGYPYGVPLSFVRAGDALYFHSAKSGHKIDAIHACDKASFTVIAQDDVVASKYTTRFRSVIAFGKVRIIEQADEKRRTAELLGMRYNPGDDQALAAELADGLDRMHMIKFSIEHITGKEGIELTRERS